MIGFIKKDMFIIKNSFKSIVIALVIYVFYSSMFEMDMSFLLPFMALMVGISTFTYDDLSNFHAFGTALPKGRINAVKSKYITLIGFILIATIIAIICSYIVGTIRDNYNFKESLLSIMGIITALMFLMSILLPFLFKYGAEKGRIAMFTIAIVIMGLYLLFTKVLVIEIETVVNVINFIKTYALPLFIVGNVLMIFISYLNSKKIYLKKEF